MQNLPQLWNAMSSASSSAASFPATLPGTCRQNVVHALVTCGWGPRLTMLQGWHHWHPAGAGSFPGEGAAGNHYMVALLEIATRLSPGDNCTRSWMTCISPPSWHGWTPCELPNTAWPTAHVQVHFGKTQAWNAAGEERGSQPHCPRTRSTPAGWGAGSCQLNDRAWSC